MRGSGGADVSNDDQLRIAIAEDSVLLRAGLVRLLQDAGEEIVGAVGDADALMDVIERQKPQLGIVDVRMPPTHTDEGIVAAVHIREHHPETAVLVLSQYVERSYVSDLATTGSGGVGYLLKDRVADVAEFLEAVRRVARGGTALDAEVVTQLMVRHRSGEPLGRLTDREREVLALMAEGKSNNAIAEAIVVSGGAVEKHISNIFLKLDLPPATG
ncbi:MAG: response regulator, partial [Acidimicrobiia bacterium]|nr:response regulator [Acidimicrobiia bacterium]